MVEKEKLVYAGLSDGKREDGLGWVEWWEKNKKGISYFLSGGKGEGWAKFGKKDAGFIF